MFSTNIDKYVWYKYIVNMLTWGYSNTYGINHAKCRNNKIVEKSDDKLHELLGQLWVTDTIVFQDFYISCVTDSIDYG